MKLSRNNIGGISWSQMSVINLKNIFLVIKNIEFQAIKMEFVEEYVSFQIPPNDG